VQYRQQKIAQERADAVEVDAWFAKFDQDGNNLLDKGELRQLLKHLHPEREPTEKLISMLVKKATEIDSYSIKLHGSENGTVSKDAAQATIKHFRAYYQEQECKSMVVSNRLGIRFCLVSAPSTTPVDAQILIP